MDERIFDSMTSHARTRLDACYRATLVKVDSPIVASARAGGFRPGAFETNATDRNAQWPP